MLPFQCIEIVNLGLEPIQVSQCRRKLVLEVANLVVELLVLGAQLFVFSSKLGPDRNAILTQPDTFFTRLRAGPFPEAKSNAAESCEKSNNGGPISDSE
jgi:hypothetical protein